MNITNFTRQQILDAGVIDMKNIFYVEFASGEHAFDLDDMSDLTGITAVDLLTAMGGIARFNNRTTCTISVLQHTMNMAAFAHRYVDDDIKITLTANGIQETYPISLSYLIKLLIVHDMHEAFTGDILGPIKNIIKSSKLKELECDLDWHIRKMLGINSIFEAFASDRLDNDTKVISADLVRAHDLYSLQTEFDMLTSMKAPLTDIEDWSFLNQDHVRIATSAEAFDRLAIIMDTPDSDLIEQALIFLA